MTHDIQDPGPSALDPAIEREARNWAAILHLSVFAGYVIPLAGLVAPIVIWQMKKNELPGIDQHGKNLANFAISMLIYTVIATILTLVLIGILFLILLGIIGIVFPIIAAIKATNGEIWKYPLTIQFLK